MNIYKHELKMNTQSVIAWSLAISILIFVYMAVFSSIAADVKFFNEMLSQFPDELLMAFGMTDLDMSSILGIYSFAFTFCQVCIAIQAANYGFSLVSVEERDMTADFLLAKPVGRPKILTSKYLSAITSLLITTLVMWIASFVFINIYRNGGDYDTQALLLLLFSIVIFQLVFLTLGVLISLLVRRIRSVTPYSMALAFGMYVLSAFGDMLGDDKFDLITPFKHFEPNYIITNGAYDLPLVSISLALILISVVGSYLLYTRRNIHTAV